MLLIHITPLLVTMQETWGAWEAIGGDREERLSLFTTLLPALIPHRPARLETSTCILKAFADLVHLFFLLSVAKLVFVPISPRNSSSLPG